MSANIIAIPFIIRLAQGIKILKSWVKQKQWSVVNFFEDIVHKRPNHPLFVFIDEKRTMTYKQFDDMSYKFAKWAQEKGIKPGSCVALVKTNSPEFVIVWYGLAKVGAKTALINHNLTGYPLANCLKLAIQESQPIEGEKQNVVIYSKDVESNLLTDDVLAALAENGDSCEFWCYDGQRAEAPKKIGNGHTWHSLDEALEATQGAMTLQESKELCKNIKATDILFYIYTSGTTGLPKAAKIAHSRFCAAGLAFAKVFDVFSSDRIYCALPIYHSSAGMVGVGMTWHKGATFVFRKKFSASGFFKDCAEYKCTVIQYIGELLRYINASPPSEYDTKHKVRLAIGNGLRESVWIEFQKRFKVKRIGEFYGSTEGNATLINPANKPGAIGFLPKLVRLIYPVRIIRVEEDDEEKPLRQKNGLCVEAKSGEVGHLVGLIKDNDPSRKFDGYTNKEANEKKIFKNVFKTGDKWFATGDLVKRVGPYVYFIDRIGDTFRWKGENCSTREIEEVITAGDTNKVIEEVNVYGVEVANQDGRTGMAYIRLKQDATLENFDFKKFYDYSEKNLAPYQRPLFLRFTEGSFELTSTFKHTKVALRKQGFDPSAVSDPLFFRNPETASYTPIDKSAYVQIQDGKFKI